MKWQYDVKNVRNWEKEGGENIRGQTRGLRALKSVQEQYFRFWRGGGGYTFQWGRHLGNGLEHGCPLKKVGWITGFEPATARTTIWCSTELSYIHQPTYGKFYRISS